MKTASIAPYAHLIPPDPAVLRKMGVVVPSDMALDYELGRWAHELADLYFARLPYQPGAVTIEQAEEVGRTDLIAETAWRLAPVGPDCLAYGCTSGSFIHGVAGEHALVSGVQCSGVPNVVTAAGSLLRAAAALNVNRVAVAAPYTQPLTARFVDYLSEGGLDVRQCRTLGLSGSIWKVPYGHTAELIVAADHPEAEAVIVACTNLPTYHVIAPLEVFLGKPIITTNQALMWAALGMIGLRPVGPGQRLLECAA